MAEKFVEKLEEALTRSITNLLKSFFVGVVSGSYWICLISCLICLLLYIGGCKKAGKGCSISLIVYIVLAAIKGAFVK